MTYTSSQNVMIAHGAAGGILALIVWPLGAVLARYLRSYNIKWTRAHYIVNGIIGLPLLIATFATGRYHAGSEDTWKTSHDRVGIALLVIFILQILFGTVIHIEKLKVPMIGWKSVFRYAHPIMGIAILGMGFHQTYSGFQIWHNPGQVPHGIIIAWGVLIAFWSILYLAGLSLVPRHWRARKAILETDGRAATDEKKVYNTTALSHEDQSRRTSNSGEALLAL